MANAGRDRALLPALTGIALAGGALAAYWSPTIPWLRTPLRAMLGIADSLESDKAVALTFDDGPHPAGTVAVLEALAAYRARATFFLVGEQLAGRHALAAEIVAAGHEVAVHCHHHRTPLRLTPSQLADDIARAADLIGLATGQAPRWYRPPYGRLTIAAVTASRRHGLEPLLWSRDSRDWEATATEHSIAARVIDGLRGGDVVLLHDADHYGTRGSWQKTVAALPAILEAIDQRGLCSASVSEGSRGTPEADGSGSGR